MNQVVKLMPPLVVKNQLPAAMEFILASQKFNFKAGGTCQGKIPPGSELAVLKV